MQTIRVDFSQLYQGLGGLVQSLLLQVQVRERLERHRPVRARNRETSVNVFCLEEPPLVVQVSRLYKSRSEIRRQIH